ncbi:MAG: metallophosphoesterase [Bacteroidales bacterium]|nr:metallophosphoesterase [Bacteroidales bacterium]MCB9013768.1 metallophosphoesterase [Bacteroidales bacterium]
MKKYLFGSSSLMAIFIFLSLASCKNKTATADSEDFNFVFMTDIHLEPERNATKGFEQAMDTINSLNPDFVITGGDLIMDALAASYGRADSLYKLYQEEIKNLKMPVHNTMGNHEIYGIYKKSGSNMENPEYGEKMFENRMGKSYYAFEHKGWKFIIVNSIEDTHKSGYIGWVDSTQMRWIKDELSATDKKMPIVISTHIPFITAYAQRYDGSTLRADSSLVVANSKEVLELFKGYNLKLVLQGHLHTIEDIFIDGIHFVTGGAVSAAWWQGPNKGFQEGFMLLHVQGENVSWKYIDYGWDAEKQAGQD